MPDYKEMYYMLVRAQLKAIGALENALLETEEHFRKTILQAEEEKSEQEKETEPAQHDTIKNTP